MWARVSAEFSPTPAVNTTTSTPPMAAAYSAIILRTRYSKISSATVAR